MTSEIEGLEKMSKEISGTKLDGENYKVQIMKWFEYLAILSHSSNGRRDYYDEQKV